MIDLAPTLLLLLLLILLERRTARLERLSRASLGYDAASAEADVARMQWIGSLHELAQKNEGRIDRLESEIPPVAVLGCSMCGDFECPSPGLCDGIPF
jgi:hypothetical protein